MPEVAVPTAPALSALPDVELMRTGTWDLSTGRTTFTTDDLAAAVGALDCPAVRRPIIKLGHVDPRFDGEPAVGWIDNMNTAAGANILRGDYAGMPGWLGPVIASAFPDRSIEGAFNFVCGLGHTHPFVVTAVALLGVTPPGISVLESLQDVAALYGVAASTHPGDRVVVTVRASKETPVPNPRPTIVAGAVSTEDVRRAYYDGPGNDWDLWITEIQLDPLQLIVADDSSGGYLRVPITVTGNDITFAPAVSVEMTYVDKAADAAGVTVTASRQVYATRAESRPGDRPKAAAPPTLPATEPETIPEGGAAVALDEGLRTRLGLAADADDDAILAALDARLNAPPPTPPALPEGVVTVDASVLTELRAGAQQGIEARAQQLRHERDTTIDAAMRAGKFAPARKEHWAKAWDADPEGTKVHLASLSPGLVPVDGPAGYAGGETASGDDEALYTSLFPGKAG